MESDLRRWMTLCEAPVGAQWSPTTKWVSARRLLIDVGDGIVFHVSFGRLTPGVYDFSWGFAEGQEAFTDRFVDRSEGWVQEKSGLFSVLQPIIVTAIKTFIEKNRPPKLIARMGDKKRFAWMIKVGHENPMAGYTFSQKPDQYGGEIAWTADRP